MLFINEYLEIDPDKKDEQWGNTVVTYNRQYWRHLIEPEVAKKNMSLIMSIYDMTNIKKMFKDPKSIGMEFIPISVMEKIRNILIGERVKADVKVNLNAIDPTAESQRERDKSLLKNRSDMEELFSALQTSIGLPEYRLINDKKLNGGKSPYMGNVEMFDQLGLNSNSDFHVNYFFQVWHRLIAEMRAQDVVNYYFEVNRIRENIDNWVNDILGKKCISGQAYVNEITGCIDLKYIAPERILLIPGKDDDGKDAVCIGYEDTVTVGDVIKRIGNSFDFNIHIPYLLTASNYRNKTEYTGLWDGDKVVFGEGSTTKLANFDQFLTYKVDIGYMEWKSWDAMSSKMGVDFHGNLRSYDKPVSYKPEKEEENGGYSKETWYSENTYKSFYLATSSFTQKLFKFGKLYHQMVEGSEDEYSSYTIFFKKEPGPTVAEVAYPWIEIIQESFTKNRWMIRRAKPKGRGYNYESLIQVANKMIAEGTNQTKIKRLITMFEEGVNEIFTIPTVGGQPVGGGINPNYDLPNGVDQGVTTFKEIIEWAVSNIKSDLGINDIREAYSPNPNDGYKLQMQALEQSRNATDYLERMIDSLLRNMAIYTCTITQDIIRYKATLPYKYLERAVGYLAIRDLQDLEGVALHRYGIFVNSFATYMDRQKILAETEQAWINKEISYEVKMLINAVDDYRKAAFILAFEKNRAQKEQDDRELLAHQRAMELEGMKQNTVLLEIREKGRQEKEQETIRGWWYYQSAMAQANSRLNIKAMQIEAEPEKISNKTDADIKKMAAKNTLENQAPL